MFNFYEAAMRLIAGKPVMPGWVGIKSLNGTKMIARNIKMKDSNIKCIGLCSSYAIIYSGSYEKTMDFINKPQYYILVFNEQSLEPYLDVGGIKEVLEAYRKVCLSEEYC